MVQCRSPVWCSSQGVCPVSPGVEHQHVRVCADAERAQARHRLPAVPGPPRGQRLLGQHHQVGATSCCPWLTGSFCPENSISLNSDAAKLPWHGLPLELMVYEWALPQCGSKRFTTPWKSGTLRFQSEQNLLPTAVSPCHLLGEMGKTLLPVQYIC